MVCPWRPTKEGSKIRNEAIEKLSQKIKNIYYITNLLHSVFTCREYIGVTTYTEQL